MKKRHLSIVSKTDKPVAPSKRTERIYCHHCKECPTFTFEKTAMPMQNAKGEWLVKSGTRMLFCDKCKNELKRK